MLAGAAMFTSQACQTSTGSGADIVQDFSININTSNVSASISSGSNSHNSRGSSSYSGPRLTNCYNDERRFERRRICPDRNGRPTTVSVTKLPNSSIEDYRWRRFRR